MVQETPMMKQYKEIKNSNKDAILFFRLGDFYEMFYDDAVVASKELGITLTGRGQDENRMPMCGIPFHAADSYISKLILKGYKVAICEQVEDPKIAKGVVKREVIKVITPGTVLDAKMLEEKSNNYLAGISFGRDSIGFAYIDVSTGEFKATDIRGENAFSALIGEIERVSPKECLVPDIIPDKHKMLEDHIKQKQIPSTKFKDIYDAEISEEKLLGHFKVKSLDSFGMTKGSYGAAAAVIDYLKETQKTALYHINKISYYMIGDRMYIDNSTRKNLELVETVRDRTVRGSLLWVLDRTKTSMGSRKLKAWMLQPLISEKDINKRLDAVEELVSDGILCAKLGNAIENIFDIERLVSRVASRTCNARDLKALADSLQRIPRVKELLKKAISYHLKAGADLEELDDIISLVSAAIADEPPYTVKEGGIIKKGYDRELDDVRDAAYGGKDWLAKLEAEERQRTGIKSLKVGFTKVFGYYIEVSSSNLSLVPGNYIRKQTLVNCERFITPELKEKESLILNAETRMNELEYEIFCRVRDEISSRTGKMQNAAEIISCLDVLCSFAAVSIEGKYVRPSFKPGEIKIKASRHPVAERTIGEHLFVPNDVKLDNENRFLLITGPNMAGKSTYMRQIAQILIMAQAGCFVPAKEADLCVIDRIFTRIGAMDDIYSGQSTFMLEMTETSNILNNATKNSLIILDEIGRGTSTFDGMAIAAAVSEFIHLKIKAKTLFATHYHEITQLADKHKGMRNINVLVKEEGDSVIFLHKIVDGPADRSYGIQVAKLAGLPQAVIERAKEVYKTLEMVENNISGGETKTRSRTTGKADAVKRVKGGRDQMGLFV